MPFEKTPIKFTEFKNPKKETAGKAEKKTERHLDAYFSKDFINKYFNKENK
tara:strand:- start:228 stop:380 length:153 start_codon:yes stop_codon:yes gene_type:complete